VRGSEVFWEAALDIFEMEQTWCCHAIAEIAGFGKYDFHNIKESKEFTKIFKPINPFFEAAWMNSGYNPYQQSIDRERRVWAMLLMEQIWKDEK